MSLTINHNAMAAGAARSLSRTYGKLSSSVQRISSGLRVNSAADDAAGLAIREMMRADITVTRQGLRNAADGLSLIQTADGALAVIDEKLTRMKELAEQASTGTYTTVQRDLINSEYQAMAAEIDRIAQATDFNGLKLLDGSVSNQHGGQGLKIHFGTSNQAAEDYYFINIGDARATSSTGLRVGGDAKNDIWGQGGAASGLKGPGCCATGFDSLKSPAGFTSGQSFSFGYNWDWQEDNDPALLTGRYLAGRYEVGSSDSLEDLIAKVNQGTQSRVGIRIDGDRLGQSIFAGGLAAICIGDEAYVFASANAAVAGIDGGVIFTTTTAEAEASYDPGLSYSNIGANTLVYRGTNNAAGAALNRLGYTTGAVPTNQKTGLELADDDLDYIRNVVAPEFQDALDDFTAGAWQANRVEVGANSHNNTQIIDRIWAAVQSRLASVPNFYNTSAEITAGLDFLITTGLYGDFSDFSNLNGVISDDPFLITELGLTELSFRITTDTPGPNQPPTLLSIQSYAGDHLGSIGTLDPLNQPLKEQDLESLVKAAARRSLGYNTQVTQLTRLGAFAGPTIDPADIGVTVTSNQNPLTLADKQVTQIQRDANGNFGAAGLAEAINRQSGQFWAMRDQGDPGMIYVFAKEGGDQNSLTACESGARERHSRAALECFSFFNAESGQWHDSGANFSLGGQPWATLKPVQTKALNGQQVWNVTLNGRDAGRERDLWIANPGDIQTPGLNQAIVTGLDRDSFQEIQNAADALWAGGEVRTQSSAQAALDALIEAIGRKDKTRADLGAMQNRLENTITNLKIQNENLQAAESRISDMDVAKEMTEFVKSNILVQAGVSMLAQANSMSQLVLSLLG